MERGKPSLWRDIQVHKRQNQTAGAEIGRDLKKSSPNPSRVTQGWLHRTWPTGFGYLQGQVLPSQCGSAP